MRILNGFWVSLVDQHNRRVLFQCATDRVTDAEFRELWNLTGDAALRALSQDKRGSVDFEIRAQKVEEAT